MNTRYILFGKLLWISFIVKVIKTDCPVPDISINVKVIFPLNTDRKGSFKEYTELLYFCERGTRRLRGHTAVVCKNTRWKAIDANGRYQTPQPLICRHSSSTNVDKPCPIKTPTNGRVTVTNKTITYFCDRGYVMKGPKKSFCRLNNRGHYYVSHPLPQCIKLEECEFPPDPNLIVHEDCCYAGDQLNLTCESDYEMEGSSLVTCQRDGKWNDTLPVCNVIHSCQDPGYVNNGMRRGSCCKTGSVLTYACNTGYEFVDVNQQGNITCLSNKKWSNENPECKPLGIPVCPTIPLTENNLAILSGFTTDFYFPWDKVELECQAHYTSNDKFMTIMCNENGQWNPKIPVCKPSNPCKRPPTIQHGRILEMINNAAQLFPINFEINIECNENYEIKSAYYGSRCLGDDKWEHKISNCTLIECKNPGFPSNAIRRGNDFHVGKTVIYYCVGDMELIGSHTRTCLESKRWSGMTPICDPGNTDCPDPGIPHNSNRTGNDFNVSDVVIYTCFKNHVLIGNGTRTCTDDGSWTGSEIACLAPDEYSDKEMITMELEETITEVARMSRWNSPMMTRSQDGGFIIEDKKGINVYFLFDASRRSTKIQFEQSKSLAKALIRKIGISSGSRGLRIGVIAFSTEAEIKVYPTRDKDDNVVLGKIDKIERQGGLGTNIANALDVLLTLIAITKRSRERQYCNNVVFVITDGKANEGGLPKAQAAELHRKRVDMYVFFIGNHFKDETFSLLTNNKTENIIKLKSHKEVFNVFLKMIEYQIDFSPCGLGRLKLIKGDSTRLKITNRGRRSAMLARILGGREVKVAWPWMVAIYYIRNTQKKFICGGSIIHRKWIMTAAHCFVVVRHKNIDKAQTEEKLANKNWVVSVGRTNLDDEISGFNVLVKRLISHPHYDPSNFYNDIALMELQNNLQYDPYIRPVCLPPPSPDIHPLYTVKENAIVTGWGHNAVIFQNNTRVNLINTNTLNELSVPLQPDSTCKKPVRYICSKQFNCSITPSNTTFCAGTGRGKEDACAGDSGGPLMQIVTSNSNGIVQDQWVAIGIVSWGVGCGIPGYYGYYTHVSHLYDWILKTTGGIELEETVLTSLP